MSNILNENSKRLAILLFGISYDSNYINGKVKSHYLIDTRQYFKNFNLYIISYFENLGFTIDIYLSTNKNILNNELIDLFNPVSSIFDEQNIKRNKKIKIGLEMIINNKEKEKDKGKNYDLILLTRFDIIFKKYFNEYSLNFNKLNLVSILELPHLIDDNFYLLPNKYLLDFYKIFCECKDNYKEEAHNLKNIFDNKFEINYIKNEFTTVENLSFYKLRYFYNIEFIMNANNNELIQNMTNDIYYFSKNKLSKIKIDKNGIINFSKLVDNKSDFSWIGYKLNGPSFYKLSFQIESDKDINNYSFLKIHNPVKFYIINQKILLNQWNSVELIIEIKSINDLFCFIFDTFIGKINIKYKNILFEKMNNRN